MDRLVLLATTIVSVVTADKGEWNVVSPGGETRCGKNTEFEFLYKVGTENKLMIEFMGGGACFSTTTCSLPEWVPVESVAATKLMLNSKEGLHNEKQVTSNWHAIYVPYCTGDGHVGNNTKKYLDQTVHHMGGVNARAVLDFAFKTFPNVTQTLTVGQSAGAVATYMWAPRVMDHYGPDVDHVMLADSYVPLFGATGVKEGLANWNMASSFPYGIVDANYSRWMSYFEGWAASFTVKVMETFPRARFGVYASNKDIVESSFYRVEGCGMEGCDWSKAMRDVLPWLRGNASNAFTYIGPGMSHTQTVDNSEYSTVSSGVRLSDWINRLITGHSSLPREVDCTPHCGIL